MVVGNVFQRLTTPCEMRAVLLFILTLIATIGSFFYNFHSFFSSFILVAGCYLCRKVAGNTIYEVPNLTGKVVIVTGSNTGIGKETVIALAKKNATVILACRDQSKGEVALKEVNEAIGAPSGSTQVQLMKLDLSDSKSIRQFVADFQEKKLGLDILINNAGVMMCPYSQTKDGFEMQFGTNHLGHFLLTILLLPQLKKSHGARIVNVSSFGHNLVRKPEHFKWELVNPKDGSGYNPTRTYAHSKLANIWFTRVLQKRYAKDGINSYALHPGAVRTDLSRHVDPAGRMKTKIGDKLASLFSKTPFEGCQTSLFCATSQAAIPGEYHEDSHPTYSSKLANDDRLANELWEKSEAWVGEKAL